jgi:hydroxymethylpyrimidine/phosphomethylpyrimidine kinase
MSVLTLLTVQNTRGVDAVQPLAPGFVLAQLDSVLEDLPPQAEPGCSQGDGGGGLSGLS